MIVLLSDEHFQRIAQDVEDRAIFLLDPEGVVTTWNRGAERIKGYTAADIVGRHFGLLYTEQDASLSKPDATLRVSATHGRFEEQGWRRRRGGAPFWAHVALTAIRDNEERIVGFAKVTRDLSATRFASEGTGAVVAREQPVHSTPTPHQAVHILAGVFEHTPEPCFLTDMRGIITLANAASAQLFCVGYDFFAGRPLINVVARQDTGAFRALLKNLADARGGSERLVEAVRMRPRGSPVFVATVRVARIGGPRPALYWTVRPTAPPRAGEASVPSITVG